MAANAVVETRQAFLRLGRHVKQQSRTQAFGVVGGQTGDDWAADRTAKWINAHVLCVRPNGWYNSFFDKAISTVETLERGTKMRGVFCQADLINSPQTSAETACTFVKPSF